MPGPGGCRDERKRDSADKPGIAKHAKAAGSESDVRDRAERQQRRQLGHPRQRETHHPYCRRSAVSVVHVCQKSQDGCRRQEHGRCIDDERASEEDRRGRDREQERRATCFGFAKQAAGDAVDEDDRTSENAMTVALPQRSESPNSRSEHRHDGGQDGNSISTAASPGPPSSPGVERY